MHKFDWYEVVNGGDLQQGDLLENIDILVPLLGDEKQKDNIPSVVETYDVIVLTQSCDIVKETCKDVLVCPIWTIDDIKKEVPHFKTSKGLEDLRTGRVVGYHLLNRCDIEGFNRDFRIIGFSKVFDLSKTNIISIAKSQNKRLRLLPPYREHFSQAFARFFMRVGLPSDIPSFL